MMNRTYLALVLAASIAATTGCATMWHNMTSDDKIGDYRLTAFRVPTSESACIDNAMRVYDACWERTQRDEGEGNITTCNGDERAALHQCSGIDELTMPKAKHGARSEISRATCWENLDAGVQHRCFVWYAVDKDDMFETFGWEQGMESPPGA